MAERVPECGELVAAESSAVGVPYFDREAGEAALPVVFECVEPGLEEATGCSRGEVIEGVVITFAELLGPPCGVDGRVASGARDRLEIDPQSTNSMAAYQRSSMC